MGNKRKVGFFIFDGMTALDLAGPMEAFGIAADSSGNARYELITFARGKNEVICENGLAIKPSRLLTQVDRLDTVIIPGGMGLRESLNNRAIASWLRSNARNVRRIVSVCTGIYGLAASGLLDGRNVTTHWRFARDVQQKFPSLKVSASSIYVQDGKFYTSAGITAGIDLSLALIEQDHGRAMALQVARELVVFLKRPGGQEQFSEPLRFQVEATDKTSDLAAWIHTNLEKDLSNRVLADKACLSERHFARRFSDLFQVTPAAYVARARLEKARSYLTETNQPVDEIARAVGFSSNDAFRRSFLKHFKVTPGTYRSTFGRQDRSRL